MKKVLLIFLIPVVCCTIAVVYSIDTMTAATDGDIKNPLTAITNDEVPTLASCSKQFVASEDNSIISGFAKGAVLISAENNMVSLKDGEEGTRIESNTLFLKDWAYATMKDRTHGCESLALVQGVKGTDNSALGASDIQIYAKTESYPKGDVKVMAAASCPYSKHIAAVNNAGTFLSGNSLVAFNDRMTVTETIGSQCEKVMTATSPCLKQGAADIHLIV